MDKHLAIVVGVTTVLTLGGCILFGYALVDTAKYNRACVEQGGHIQKRACHMVMTQQYMGNNQYMPVWHEECQHVCESNTDKSTINPRY